MKPKKEYITTLRKKLPKKVSKLYDQPILESK